MRQHMVKVQGPTKHFFSQVSHAISKVSYYSPWRTRRESHCLWCQHPNANQDLQVRCFGLWVGICFLYGCPSFAKNFPKTSTSTFYQRRHFAHCLVFCCPCFVSYHCGIVSGVGRRFFPAIHCRPWQIECLRTPQVANFMRRLCVTLQKADTFSAMVFCSSNFL